MSKDVAIITGASRGLGLELALQLTNQKLLVIGVSRNKSNDNRFKDKLTTNQIVPIIGDVSDQHTVAGAFAKANQLGKCSILINCAGEGVFGKTGSFTREDIDNVLRGNLIGTILFCEAAKTYFSESGGIIVNVMSTAAHIARANEAIYCASKWGARGYTESLRLECKGSNIDVIAVYPGGMNTDFWKVAKGSKIDSNAFMAATEVAETILQIIKRKPSMYVSDVIINRR